MFDGVLVDKVMVVLVECAVERHAVGLEEQVLKGVDALQPEGLLDAVGQVGVVKDHVEAERLGAESNRAADAPCKEKREKAIKNRKIYKSPGKALAFFRSVLRPNVIAIHASS